MSDQTLYERLGGADGIHAITEDIWTNHTSNPAVKNRYAKSDPENVKQKVREFFGAGTGGPETYTGEDMLTAHTGMNINDTTAGFVCYNREVLETIDLNAIKFIGYAFQIEMKFKAYLKGFKITEVPVIFTDRTKGVSKLSSGIISEAIFGVITMKTKSLFKK